MRRQNNQGNQGQKIRDVKNLFEQEEDCYKQVKRHWLRACNAFKEW